MNNLYKYKWIDISHDNEWWDIKDIDKVIKEEMKPMECVGYLLKKTKDFYIFSSGYDPNNDKYFDRVIYPKGVIISLTKL